jgi:hypothetical protein
MLSTLAGAGFGCPHKRTEGLLRRVFGLAARDSRLIHAQLESGGCSTTLESASAGLYRSVGADMRLSADRSPGVNNVPRHHIYTQGGLGSRHTPGAWPLGHIQAWLVGRAQGDGPATAAALERLEQAAFADGMFPEALVPDGAATSPVRHWFAWPGAALGAFTLLDRRQAWDTIAAVRQAGHDRPESPNR